MEEIRDKFAFWCPIEKSEDLDPTTGETIMKLGGIASTSDEDSDGEFLDPKGFDIKPLVESGVVNWHHQAKGQPGAIIGEPIKAEIRPEGLYIETKLYPSSKIACDVWELAKTLERDSKNRRLGYSIEGKVVKRKSNDVNSPDYKKIEKAIITGVAVTHQPKNPKTFANIIKGEIDELNDSDEVHVEKKKNKSKTFTKSQVMEKLFKDVAGITIEKAEQVYILIQKIANMGKEKRKNRITDEDISKAYEALGLDFDPSDIQKGCGDGDNRLNKSVVKKSKSDPEDDEEYEEEEEVEETEDDDDDEEEEEKEEEVKKSVKKGGIGSNRFDRIEKAIATSHHLSTKYVKALGVMIKDASEKLARAAEREEELLDIVKSQENTISDLYERIEDFGSEVQAPKSLSSARAIERRFSKGEEDEFSKGNEDEVNANVISMSKRPNDVAEILDQATFAKGGYDDEFSKAVTAFEATHSLPSNIIARLKNEFGVEIVK